MPYIPLIPLSELPENSHKSVRSGKKTLRCFITMESLRRLRTPVYTRGVISDRGSSRRLKMESFMWLVPGMDGSTI